MTINIKVKFKPKNKNISLPQYKTIGASGFDIQADILTSIKLRSLDRVLVPTGLYFEIPEGYEIQIRPRSGLAIKYGITVLNSPGTIDSDYRGELQIILFNASKDDFEIKPGDRIAQGVIARVEKANFIVVDDIENSERGEGGFGHTGI